MPLPSHNRPIRQFFAAGVAVLALAPAAAMTMQATQDAPVSRPKSLLPDALDTPPVRVTAPVAAPIAAPPAADAVSAPAPTGETPNAVPALPSLLTGAPASPSGPDPFATAQSGGDIHVLGPLSVAMGGYGMDLFATSNGPFLAALANRIVAPGASRWGNILLRRALLTESAAPVNIAPADWAAARALLLMHIGEIDGARALVDAVPVDRYTPALYRVAAQVALAAADIGGLCPIASTGVALSRDPLWKLAVGMCAAIQGDDITSARVFDDLRGDEETVDGFDVRLGERVATISGGAGRATNIEWSEAPRLTPYRFGVATAAGVAVPPEKLAELGPARFGWLVRAAGVAPEVRLVSLRPAAVAGSVSASELVSGITALSPAEPAEDSAAGHLRTAFAGGSEGDRRSALMAIWASGDAADGRYGALIESAMAAARLPVSADSVAQSADIIAALLSIGDLDGARRWWPVADKAEGKVRARAWALLATGGAMGSASGFSVDLSAFKDWRSAAAADPRHAALLMAGLAGLGIAKGSEWDGVRAELIPASATRWSRAIDAAATAGRGGEVAILAATGMQGGWRDVPPLHLAHILAALVKVGRGEEARLIAAEAVTRG